ncbi:MAG TPA: hypothetical protein VL749_08105 [Patescibacteria group bacterium]|nr:hypothetical protein [Patescibacteria group bacterium]
MRAPEAVTGLPLTPGSVLLHIGPHKTGTTSVQSALHLARAALRRRGIHYAGPDRHPVIAAQAAIEEPAPGARRRHPIARWNGLLGEIARHRSELVVLSSEWFADAEPSAIRRIVGQLGAERVHVVVTLRPLVRLLPSQWQQYVAAGSTIGYEAWLESVFGPPEGVVTPSFWQRHRHDQLVERWSAVVGVHRVTVVILDEVDRRGVLHAFESLTGLDRGSLVAEADRVNRSFTAPEAELLREMNVRLAAEVQDANLRLNLGLYGAAAGLRLREPAMDEPRIETPAWAVDRAIHVGGEIAAGIERSGVRVMGDLDRLAVAPATGTGPSGAGAGTVTATAVDWPGIVAAAASGALTASGLARTGGAARARLEPLSNERLRRVVAQRVRNAVRNRLDVLRDGAGRGSSSDSTGADRSPVAPLDASPEVETALARLAGVLRNEGLPRTLYDSVTSEGVMPELQRIEPRPAHEAADWPRIGAAFVVGIVRASGLVAGAGGTARRRLPPPRAGIETLEVAGVSTPAVAAELGRRILVGMIRPSDRRTA